MGRPTLFILNGLRIHDGSPNEEGVGRKGLDRVEARVNAPSRPVEARWTRGPFWCRWFF